MASTLGKQLSSMRGAAKIAFDNAYRLTGRQTDPELLEYEKLKVSDFDTLAENFGMEAVSDYIKNMEAKLIQRKERRYG